MNPGRILSKSTPPFDLQSPGSVCFIGPSAYREAWRRRRADVPHLVGSTSYDSDSSYREDTSGSRTAFR